MRCGIFFSFICGKFFFLPTGYQSYARFSCGISFAVVLQAFFAVKRNSLAAVNAAVLLQVGLQCFLR